MQSVADSRTAKPKSIQVKLGSVSVPIYNYGDDRWAIIYREAKGAKRKTVFCKTESAARAKAQDNVIPMAAENP